MNKFLFLIVFLFSLIACKKYNESDGLTTYSVKGRYKNGFWNCYKIVDENDGKEIKIPKFSCILDSYGIILSDTLVTNYYFTDGKSNKYNNYTYYAFFRSKKEVLKMNPDPTENNNYIFDSIKKSKEIIKSLEFKIHSLTWKEMILESKETKRKYYFDKYITTISKDISFDYVEDKTFKFPGFE